MGFEYKIHVASMNVDRFACFIRNSPFFTGYDAHNQLYNLCLSGLAKPGEMPDATVALENDGIYFCNHNSSRMDAILHAVMEEAKRQS
jgi:hypothetical protein